MIKQGRIGLWALTGQGVLFFDIDNPAGPVLNLYDFATLKTTLVRKFPKNTIFAISSMADTSLSVSTDGRWAIYTQVDQASSNLMLVENFE